MCETEPLEDQVIQAVKYTKEKLRRGVKEERVQECLKHLNRRAEISIVIKDLIEKRLLILVSINMQINVVLKYFDKYSVQSVQGEGPTQFHIIFPL